LSGEEIRNAYEKKTIFHSDHAAAGEWLFNLNPSSFAAAGRALPTANFSGTIPKYSHACGRYPQLDACTHYNPNGNALSNG
jgi:hypothetical protein